MSLLLQFVPCLIAAALGAHWGIPVWQQIVMVLLVFITGWLRGYLYGFRSGVETTAMWLLENASKNRVQE